MGPKLSAIKGTEFTVFSPAQNKGPSLALTDITRPALRNSLQDSALLMKNTLRCPDDGSPSFYEAVSTRHGTGQMLKLLLPTQLTDAKKQSCLRVASHTSVQKSQISFRASNKRPAHVPVHNDQNPPKKARLKPSDITQAHPGKAVLKHLQAVPPPQNKNRRGLKVSCQETEKISAQGPSDDLQAAHNQARMDFAMSYTESNNPLSSHVPGQPLRMIFKRLYSDNWSSRLVTPLSSQTPEKTSLPDTRPASPEMPECHGSHVPLSVLYEDLWVSSSSEESDLE